MTTFDFAKSHITHLVVQPADARLNPPESYFFVQDGLIISCGVLYALCYFFYMTRTVADKTCAGAIEYTCGTMAYELYYAFATTSTRLELACFLIWFAMDFTFAAVTIRSTVPPARRWTVITTMIIGFISGIAILKGLTVMYPDEREQLTAYWTGIVLQLPISGGTLWLLIQNQHTRGQSLEIWITRYLGCFTSYGVFVWRYLNNPDAWSYVASPWSRWIIYSTLAPETVYPFVYVWIHYKNAKSKAD